MAAPLIRAEEISVERSSRGREPVSALVRVSVAVEKGELVLVLGRPGSGKSTLLESLAGLLPLQGGNVSVVRATGSTLTWGAGEAVPSGVRDGVGLLFQFPERQLVGRTAREDVLWAGTPRPVEAVAAEELARAGVPPALWDVPIGRLSRGEKRRVALAGVLARRPQVLLLDEPAVGLDPEGQALVWEEVTTYRRGGGAVVLATHWPESALPRADRVLCLDRGRAHFSGAVAGLQDAAREDSLLRGLLPFTWRLRLFLECGDLPHGSARWREVALRTLTEISEA